MSAQITLDTLDLDVETLETIPIDFKELPDCYPLPALRRAGPRQVVALRTAVLENPFLKVVVALDLGGRILRILDKRTDCDILPFSLGLHLGDGGRRGLQSGVGWQVAIDRRDRPNALGPVDFLTREPDDEDDPAELWLFELEVGSGLSWHQRLAMAPDRAEFSITLKLFNRNLSPKEASPGWRVALADAELWQRSPREIVVHSPSRDAGFVLATASRALVAKADDGFISLSRWGDQDFTLLPRETVSVEATVVPFSKLGGVTDASTEAAMSVTDGRITVMAASEKTSCKLFIQTRAGQTLEAPINLSPTRIEVVELPEPAEAAAIAEPGKPEFLRWERGDKQHAPRQATLRSSARESLTDPGNIEAQFLSLPAEPTLLVDALFSPLLAPVANILLGTECLKQAQYDDADAHFEDALSRNAEDPLLWWLKAVGRRAAGDEDRPELLNAHFLAPLEPAMRAESFLSQPKSADRAPNPLVAPLADSPDSLVEVACLLLSAHRMEDAARWIDEALRHRNAPMLRLLHAWALLEGPGLKVEARSEVRHATAGPPEPPFPWRPIERKAIEQLHREFPDVERLGQWLQLAQAR